MTVLEQIRALALQGVSRRNAEAAGVVTYCDGRHVKTRGTSAAPDTHKEKA